jgi:dCTP deaminase
MVLSRREILKRLEKEDLRFDPPVPRSAIAQCSIDLRLGRNFASFKRKEHEHIAALRIQSAKKIFEEGDFWDQGEKDRVIIRKNELILAQTYETVYLPGDLMGLVEGRSSWARFGIGVHVTAPKIDPGYDKPITLELTNYGDVPFELVSGGGTERPDEPCQLILVQLSSRLKKEELYGYSRDDLFAHHTKPVPVKGKHK